MSADVKRYEVEAASDDGAQELDVVLNLGRLKDGETAYVLRELRDLVEAAEERTVKVIIEACLLTRDERSALPAHCRSRRALCKNLDRVQSRWRHDRRCQTAARNGRAGFGVKAAGGIRDAATALAMIEAGRRGWGPRTGWRSCRGWRRQTGRIEVPSPCPHCPMGARESRGGCHSLLYFSSSSIPLASAAKAAFNCIASAFCSASRASAVCLSWCRAFPK